MTLIRYLDQLRYPRAARASQRPSPPTGCPIARREPPSAEPAGAHRTGPTCPGSADPALRLSAFRRVPDRNGRRGRFAPASSSGCAQASQSLSFNSETACRTGSAASRHLAPDRPAAASCRHSLDPHQAAGFDHRPDIVEHSTRDRGRLRGCHQQGQNPPRDVPTNTARSRARAAITASASAISTAGL